MESYMTRLPIMDGKLSLYAYEMAFRPGNPEHEGLPVCHSDAAPNAQVQELYRLGPRRVAAGNSMMIKFSPPALEYGAPRLFPSDMLIVEVSGLDTPYAEAINALRELKEHGYRIAVEGLSHASGMEPLLELCDLIKVDIRGLSELEMSRIKSKINSEQVLLMASCVDTRREFEQSAAMGFKLFQGYFFSRVALEKDAKVNPSKMQVLHLMSQTMQPTMDFKDVAETIYRDLGLSYRLLKLVNSVVHGTRREIKDIRHALSFLGESSVRKWVMLIGLIDFAEGRPQEMVLMSMVRAHFCEAIARRLSRDHAEHYFLAGLFSMMDVITGARMETVLASIALPSVVQMALLEKRGPAEQCLRLASVIESADFYEADMLARDMRLAEKTVATAYTEALIWSGILIESGEGQSGC